ncbi:hypothetical protein GGR53DRAFT_465259 [Hypoxylon sp. FL1150]|nr:hypothetical protein GGR53DRAFT_465259 [Hypoxylon sp. FL1150]
MRATFASLLAAILPALTVGQRGIDGNPSQDYSKQPISVSCNDMELSDGHYLDAACLEPPQWPVSGSISTRLDLNNCLANYGGHLAYAEHGSFASSCSDCVLAGSHNDTLACECSKGKDKGTAHSEWDLNEWHYIQNTNGNLTCYHFQE